MKILKSETYKQSLGYTCGPCSYMESFMKKKNKRTEFSLHEKGRIKPAKIFLGISHLELNPKLTLYVDSDSSNLGNRLLKIIYDYENFKKTMSLKQLKETITNYYGSLLKKHSKKIITLKGVEKYISLIDKLLKKKKKVLLLTHSGFWCHPGAPHWVVIRGKDKSNYIVGDPRTGYDILFTKKEMKEQLQMLKKEKISLQLVSNS